MTDEQYMREALRQAKKAYAYGEVPIGCVIVKDDRIIARGYNRRNTDRNTLSHAELNAIRKASRVLGDWRLEGCTLYVTLEPCQMCAGAIVQARVSRVVMGSMNPKAGCAGSILNLLRMDAFNHQVEITRDVLREECGKLLSDFFRDMREERRKKDPPKNFLKRLRVQLPGYEIAEAGEESLADILALMRENVYFMEKTDGRLPDESSCRELLETLPPGSRREQKSLVLLRKKGRTTALLELVEGYPEEDCGYVGLFLLSVEAQGKGIGRKLFKHAVKAAGEAGLKRLRLACFAENERGLSFWKKQQFTVVRELEREGKPLLELEREIFFD